MKRPLAPVVTLLLLAPTVALAARQPDRDLQSLDAANRALEGRRANIELADGTVLTGVDHVFLAPDATTWEDEGEIGQAATADVHRITLTKQSRIRRWSRNGAIVGVLAGSLGGGYSDVDGVFIEPLDASHIAKGALAGAAVGAAAGAMAGEKVVFEAHAEETGH